MPSGRNRHLPLLSDKSTRGAERAGAVAMLITRVAHAAPVARASTAARAAQAAIISTRVRHRRWPRIALGVLITAVLLAVLLVPPQSLRATLATLLIVAVLGVVVWRLPMTDDE